MQKTPFLIFSVLCLGFLLFSLSIYLKPPSYKGKVQFMSDRAMEGKLIWQKYNCQSCHQMYGLGGYLGPDLTNVYSKYQKNDATLKAFFKGGFLQMPQFHLEEREENVLIEFLKAADETGSSDPRKYKKHINGMIERQ
jgi:nitric oxide reductase subunit C